VFDALPFLEGRTIKAVERAQRLPEKDLDGDEIIVLRFTDGTFAEFHGFANWEEQETSIGVAYSDISGAERKLPTSAPWLGTQLA
jgi:hypothetical protein